MSILTSVFVASLLACFVTTTLTAESKNRAAFDARAAAILLKNALGWTDKEKACSAYFAIWSNITFEQEKQLMNEMGELFDHRNYILTRLYIGRYGFCHTDKKLAYPVPSTLNTSVHIDALILQAAMKGMGTVEEKLVEVFVTRTHDQLQEISRKYFLYTGSNLRDDLSSDLSGEFEYFIFQMLDNADRDKNRPVNMTEAAMNAKKLYHYGIRGNHRETTDMFVRNSKQQLLAIFDEFHNKYGQAVETLFENSKFCVYTWAPLRFLDCNLRDALKAMVDVTRDMPAYLAVRVHEMLQPNSIETFDDFVKDPATIFLSRQYTDLKEIVATYREMYNNDFLYHLNIAVWDYYPGTSREFSKGTPVRYRNDYVHGTSDIVAYSFGN